MLKRFAAILIVVGIVLTMALPIAAQGDAKVFY